MRLLTGARSEADDQRDPGDEDENGDDTNQGGEGEGQGAGDENQGGGDEDQGSGDDTGGEDQGSGEDQGGDQDEGGAAASAAAGISAETRVRLLSAFERDANQLVSQERERCISIFTSENGRRNPEGCAALLRDTDMDATKAGAFLATFGNSRTNARERLRGDSSTRVETGAGRESSTGASDDVVAAHRKRQNQRNPKGGKRVNADVDSSPAGED